jgi:hypothetical protein
MLLYMKASKENIKILKKLGFSCEADKTQNSLDREWYSLKNGWGFRLDAHKNFEKLFLFALKYNEENSEQYEEYD